MFTDVSDIAKNLHEQKWYKDLVNKQKNEPTNKKVTNQQIKEAFKQYRKEERKQK